MDIRLAIEFTLLLLIANGTPVLAGLLLHERWDAPLDGGRVSGDGQRLFGPAKTLRGLLASIAATTPAAAVLGLGWAYGVLFGTLAMLGDALSSYIKRRLGYPASCAAPGLDQVPESLLPLLLLQPMTGAAAPEILAAVLVFFILDLLLSRFINPGQARCR